VPFGVANGQRKQLTFQRFLSWILGFRSVSSQCCEITAAGFLAMQIRRPFALTPSSFMRVFVNEKDRKVRGMIFAALSQ
jgi:hypothetical protein